MATEPVRAAASPSALKFGVTFHDPLEGDVWTYIASQPNAALAIAAAYESVDEQTLVDVIGDVTLSPMFAAAKACYRADLRRIQSDEPVDASSREDLALDILLSRAYLAGAVQHMLPKAVR